MNTLTEFLEADDQMVARQLITAIGYETGLGHADYDHPVGPDTLLIMSPLDADFFAYGYMDAILLGLAVRRYCGSTPTTCPTAARTSLP